MFDRRAVRLGALMCTGSAACYAGLSIMGKLALAGGMTLTGMLSIRFLGAAAVLASILLLQRRRLGLDRSTAGRLVLLGALLYAPQAAFFFSGLQRLPASVAVLLLYVYPVIVAVFDWSFNRRPPDRRIVLALVLASIGVGLTLYPQPTTSVDPIGAVLVLASATGLSAYIILSERATRAAGARVGALGIVFGAGLSFALAGAMGGNLEWRSAAAQPALLLGLIIIGTVLPVTLFLAGVARVGPTGASLLSTLEPVFTVALGAVVLGESLIPIQWLGGGLILAAGLLVATRPTPAAEAAPTL